MTSRELFLTSILGCRRVDLYVNPRPLTLEEENRLADMEARLNAGEPPQYIVGSSEFLGLLFAVDHRVLIPRPETEILVDSAVHLLVEQFPSVPSLKFLDIGTGSGNIAVSLAKSFATSDTTAIDISPDALAVAHHNATVHGVADRIHFQFTDVRTYFVSQAKGQAPFDAIFSNPPYISTHQLSSLPLDVQHEPHGALDGGADGLYYLRYIIQQGGHFLRPGGFLFLEIGDGQAAAVTEIFKTTSFSAPVFIKDHVGTQRVVWARRQGSDTNS